MGPKKKNISDRSNKYSPKSKKCSLQVKVKRRNYSQEQMNLALEAVKDGIPHSQAAKTFSVPSVTLIYKAKGKVSKSKCGPEAVFSEKEEEYLIHWIMEMGKAEWRQNESNIGSQLKKRHFAMLLDSAIKKSVLPNVLQNGFRKCGIYPWNVESINFNLVSPKALLNSQAVTNTSQ